MLSLIQWGATILTAMGARYNEWVAVYVTVPCCRGTMHFVSLYFVFVTCSPELEQRPGWCSKTEFSARPVEAGQPGPGCDVPGHSRPAGEPGSDGSSTNVTARCTTRTETCKLETDAHASASERRTGHQQSAGAAGPPAGPGASSKPVPGPSPGPKLDPKPIELENDALIPERPGIFPRPRNAFPLARNAGEK